MGCHVPRPGVGVRIRLTFERNAQAEPEWAEIADVSGIDCVGIIKSCPEKEKSDVEISCHRHGGQSGNWPSDGDPPGPRFLGAGLVARNRANLEQTAAGVKAAGAEALVIDLDLSQPAAARAVVDQTSQALAASTRCSISPGPCRRSICSR